MADDSLIKATIAVESDEKRAELKKFIAEYQPGPGKFEGEPPETEWFYNQDLEGSGEPLSYMEDGAGTYVSLIPVDDDERELFGFAADVTYFVIEITDQGFVDGGTQTDAEADVTRARCQEDDEEDDETPDADGHPEDVRPCPICGTRTAASELTKDGRLIGDACKDAFTIAQWNQEA